MNRIIITWQQCDKLCEEQAHKQEQPHSEESPPKEIVINYYCRDFLLSWLILVMLVNSLEWKCKRKLKPVLGCSPAPGGISAQAPDYKQWLQKFNF